MFTNQYESYKSNNQSLPNLSFLEESGASFDQDTKFWNDDGALLMSFKMAMGHR